MSNSNWKLRWIAITPKPFTALSVCASACIIKHIVTDQKRRSSVYHRLALALAIFSLFGAIAGFVGTWAIPAGSPGVYLASGTDLTCSVQGFCLQLFGIGTGFYYTSLSVYYYLTINYGWKEKKLKSTEKRLHGIPILVAVTTSIVGAILNLYHNAQIWCFIAPPAKNFNAYRLGLFYGTNLAAMLFATALMILIIMYVLQQERAMDKYNVRAPDGSGALNTRKNTRRVAQQAVAYVIAFYLTLTFALITRVSQMISGSVNFTFVALFTIFMPSQGIFPFIVYFRPHYLHYRRQHRDLNFVQILVVCIRNLFGSISKLRNRDSSKTHPASSGVMS